MEKIKSQLYDLDENIDNYLFYDKEKYEEEVAYAIGEEKGIEKGIEQGRNEGIHLGETKIIKALYENGLSIEKIHDYLKIISIDEIKNIVENNSENND